MSIRPAKAHAPNATPVKSDGRRIRGDRTRALVLERAMQVASTKGLEGITMGELADDLQLGKSNLTVLFGDKLSLQKAILDAAVERFREHIVFPVENIASPLDRLRELCDGWFRYIENRVFSGGCFLYAAINELRARPGELHDHATRYYDQWKLRLGAEVKRAIEAGEAAPDTDIDSVVFAIKAYQNSAHLALQLGDKESFARAQRMVHEQIDAIDRRKTAKKK